MDYVVVVAGIPGSGKTTLARAIARELRLPLVSKDVIKEALFDALDSGDLEWSRLLGGAAHRVMYAIAHDLGPVVLESHFWPGVAEPDLRSLGRPMIQVYCRCPVALAEERYRERIGSPDRHPGHLPEHQTEAAIERWRSAEPVPLHLNSPVIEIDTTRAVDIPRLAEHLRRLMTE